MPPLKSLDEGTVDFHAAFTPLNTLSFVSPTVACCAQGGSICLWNLEDGSKDYIQTTSYSVTRLCSCPATGSLAFCEGGTSPRVCIYATAPVIKLLFTLTNVTELELADLAFSACGSRLYTLSKAGPRQLLVFSTHTGAALKGCEVELPVRFDKIAVYPRHKDHLAVVRSSSIRIITFQKSYETYLSRLQPPSLPNDVDVSISAYSWLNTCHFMLATRSGSVCVLDGTTGSRLHVCHAQQPVVCIAALPNEVVTVHTGNVLRLWTCDLGRSGANASVCFPNAQAMELGPVFEARGTIDLEEISRLQDLEHRLLGQVACLQVLAEQPSHGYDAALVTMEGEVWTMCLQAAIDQINDTESPEQQRPGDDAAGLAAARGLQLRFVTWFHTHPITALTFLGFEGRICASADEGGRLRIWEVSRGSDPKGVRLLRFTSALTALAPDDEGNLLLASSANGCVHVLDCSVWCHVRVLHTLRLGEAGVARLRCTVKGEGSLLAAAAGFDDRIAFFTVNVKEPKIHMLGFMEIGCSIEDLYFHSIGSKRDAVGGPSPALLVAGTAKNTPGFGLWAVQPPPADYNPSAWRMPSELCPVSCCRLGSDSKLTGKPISVASTTEETVAIGFGDGSVRIYPVPAAGTSGVPISKLPVTGCLDILTQHSQPVQSIHVCFDGSRLLSCCMDGSFRQTHTETKETELEKSLHSPYTGGVAHACFSGDHSMVLSSGGADGLVVWCGPGLASKRVPVTHEKPAEGTVTSPVQSIDVDDADLHCWAPWEAEETVERQAQGGESSVETASDPTAAIAHRKHLSLEVDALRRNLRVLIEENEKCPELEVLDRSEFCVDSEERSRITEETKRRCDALRAQIEKENFARQLIRDRLVKEFWEPMRTKGCRVCSLMPDSSLSVSNYPARVEMEEEKNRIRKLQNLRKIEKLELQMLVGPQCPHGLQGDLILKADPFTSGKEEYVVNWWPSRGKQSAAGEGEENPSQFLYEPFELLTNGRRRLQIYLLQSFAAEHRSAFNRIFEACQNEKRSIMDQIREKTARIRAIHGELQIEEVVPEPELHDNEDPEFVLHVKDKEILFEKWISPEERKLREEAALREEERLRQLRENDAGQRALVQMMGGTLKTKKDLSALEITLDREPWMDEVAEEQMTEVQKQLLKEFQEKEKALLEEQDKYRKQLDAELKTLRLEVQELMQQFEAALREVHHKRFNHDAESFCQELYCIRLQLALMQSVEDNHMLQQSGHDLEQAATRLAEAEQRLADFRETVAAAREHQDDRVRYEKEVASAQHFRQQFTQAGVEAEHVTTLLQMFRKRRRFSSVVETSDTRKPAQPADARNQPKPGSSPAPAPVLPDSGGGAGAGAGTGGTRGDPYPDLGSTSHDEAFDDSQLAAEDTYEECPEGIDEGIFGKMLDLRRERDRAELEVQKGSSLLQDMGALLAHYQQERDSAKAGFEQRHDELRDHLELMEHELFDIEILFKLKQGQVEVPQAAVVTDYSDAIVIDDEVVESRNRRILELGREKVGTLDTIKEFRKKLNFIEWEHKMLALQTTDLEERTKEVQMLKMNKKLQSLLKGGEEGRNKADADLLERKIEHLKNTTAQKEQSLRKQYAMGTHSAKLRKMENGMLEKKLKELQQNVIQREHIRRLRAPQGGAAATTANKEAGKPRITGGGGRVEENEVAIRAAQTNFREVKTRQAIMNQAKKHTEEIEVLRKELDRLRQRTFPSFVQLHEDRPSNPDYSMPRL